MSEQKRKDDLLTAVALNEFSVHYRDLDPELADRAWMLAADCLVDYDLEPREVVAERKIGSPINSRETYHDLGQ